MSGSGPAIGLIGCGRWGANILRDLNDLGAVVTVVDPSPAARRRARAASAHRVVDAFADLGPVRAAVVATPASHHVNDLEALADRAVPVFCEKPLATSIADAQRIRDTSTAPVHVMHVWRHHPAVEVMGGLAADGAIGEVVGLRTIRTNWTSPRTDVDAVWTMLPHDLSLSLELLGRIPVPQAATADVVDGRAQGLWALCGDPATPGPWFVTEGSTRSADRRREIRLYGSDGVAVHVDGAPTVRVERGRAADPVVEVRPLDPEPALRRQLRRWLEFLDGGPAPSSALEEGMAVVENVVTLRRLAGLDP